MQGTTNDHPALASLTGVISGAVLTAILVVAFVVASLGLGSEGAGRASRLVPPPEATLGQ